MEEAPETKQQKTEMFKTGFKVQTKKGTREKESHMAF